MHLKKRVLPFFFSLVLAIGLFPSYGFAAGQADDPEVSVAAVTASGMLGGCSWEYDGDTNTLTVHYGDGSSMSSDEKSSYDAAKATATTIVFQKSDGNEYVRGFADTASLVSGAAAVETLDLTGLDNSMTATGMSGMFTGCDKLTTVIVGESFTFKDSENSLACTLPDGMWKVASTGIIASAHDVAEARAIGTVETYTKQADSPEPSNNQSYTVRYLEQGTGKELATAKVVGDQPVGTVVTENAPSITGYTVVGGASQSITIDTSGNVITFYYTANNDLFYTVKYLEQGTDKRIHDPKVEGGQTVGTEVTANAIEIDGYNRVGDASQTITIGTSNNEITFYYTPRNDLSYMVMYLEKDSDNPVGDAKTVTNQTFGTQVTVQAIDIEGYDAVSPTAQTITIGTSGNLITFYYTKADENGGNNGDDDPPANPGKPSTGDPEDQDPDDFNGDGNTEAPTHLVMHRLYNPNSGEHFFTTSAAEKANLVNLGWKDEGEGWVAATSGTSVYRLYNPNAGEHHYTTSSDERAALIAAGWNDEGVGFYSDDDKGTPLYRLYNPNEFANNHHYTRNTAERDALKALGWRDEGIGWYGIS